MKAGPASFLIEHVMLAARRFTRMIPLAAAVLLAAGRLSAQGGDAAAASVPDLTISKATPNSAFVGGNTGRYTLRVRNVGAAPTSGTVTVVDALPAELTLLSTSGTGWSCSAAGQTVTCTSSRIVTPGNYFPTLSLDVRFAVVKSPTSITNTATVSGGGEANTGNNSSSLTRTLFDPDPEIDASIVKSHVAPFVAGQQGSYTIQVANVGTRATSAATTVTDVLPAGISFVSAMGTGWQCGATGSQLSCTYAASIAAGTATPDITIVVAVSPTAPSSVTNTATVATTGDRNAANNSSTVVTPVSSPVPAPDLAIVKSAPASFTIGASASYTLAVSNVGTGATTGTITVTDNLPAGLTFVAATGAGWSCGAAGNAVTCTSSGILAAGASASPITLTLGVAAAAAPSVTNTGVVATTGDTNSANNSSTVTTPVQAPPPALDLSIQKLAGELVVGRNGTFTIAVHNFSAVPTTGTITVTDQLQAGLTFVSGSGGGFTCSAAGQLVTCTRSATLGNGESATIVLTVAVGAAAAPSVTNTAVVSTPGDSDPTNDSSTITRPVATERPDLEMTKTAGAGVDANGRITFTLSVRNVGGAPTTGTMTITDVLQGGLTFVSATGSGWTCGVSGQAITCTNPAVLAPGATTQVVVVASVSPSLTSISNTATVKTPGDDNPDNDSDTVTVAQPIRLFIDLRIVKRAVTDSFTVGEPASYTLTVTNVGNLSTTAPITVTDVLADGLTFVSASGPGWSCTFAARTVTCINQGPLAPGASSTVTVNVIPTAAAVPTVANTGRVKTPGDDEEDNDETTVTTPVAPAKRTVDLSIVKTGPASFTVGGGGKYTLTVRNNGTRASDAPVTVTDMLPPGVTFVSASGQGWSCSAVGSLVTCTRPTPLQPGESSTIEIIVAISAPAMPFVTNCARVSVPNEDGTLANNESCLTTPVHGEPKLEIEKRTSRAEAQIGDVIDYTILVKNTGTADLPAVLVRDDLPVGFSYVSGTARVDGVPIADPAGAPGPHLTFSIGRVARGAVVTLTYRVRVGVGARVGINTNVAIARDTTGTIQSPQGRATTRVAGGLFDERGAIVGKVFTQCNCASAMQEGGEVGIPGVRVFLEDGTSAITDVEGKYSFTNVSSRLHVVKVDRQSLPAGAALVPLGNRHAGDGWTRFADVKGGELHKADFAEGSGSAAVLAQVLERRRAGEVENAGRQIRDDAAPVATANGRAAGDTSAAGSSYRSILGYDNTLSDLNSQLPATPLRALQAQRGVNPSASADRVRLQVPQQGIPADGQTMVQVAVSVLDAAGNPLSGRVAATLETSLGRWLGDDLDHTAQARQVVLENGGGVFTLVSAAQPGRGEVRVTTDLGTQTLPVHFVPVARPLVAAGLLNARIDFRALLDGGRALASDADGFEEALRDWSFDEDSSRVRGGARGALFLKGRVLNDRLLTLSYDSERDRGRTYFRDIRPDEFFAVYGDASIREFDAQSRRRFYARLDNGTSFTMFGDFQTTRADDRRILSAYDRTLNGSVQHLEGRRGRATLFASQGRVRQVVDELPGRGISGPYVLTRTDGLVNSERVEIITRDRNQPTVILSRQVLTRFADYTIEPLTGRLIFRVPVPSADANLNPVLVRVTYEAERVGSDQFWVYGGDAALRLSDAVEVGGTLAIDENPAARTELAGVNATARLAPSTFVTGEYARTENGGASGDAARVELRHQSSRVEGRLFAARSDSAFENPSSTFLGGRTELGGRFSALLDDRTRLVGEALHTERTTGPGGARDGALLAFQRQLDRAWRVEVGYRYARERGERSPNLPNFIPVDRDVSAVRARIDWTLPERTRSALFAEYEQDVRDDSYRAALGGEYVIASRARLYGRHEWLTGVEGAYAINGGTTQQYTVFGIDADYLKNTQMFSEYRARDAFAGRDAEAAIGLRNRWAVAPGLLVNTSFERVSPLFGGVPGNTLGSLGEALAVTGAVEWTRPALWKSTARLEFRDADAGDNFLASFGYARKLSRDWTLLGRTLWDVYDTGANQTRGWSQLGLSWRETDRNRWNALVRYENRLAHTGAVPGTQQTETLAHIVAGLLNFQPTTRLTLSGRYAAKASRDELGVASTRTTSQLLMGRGIYDLSRRFDAGVMASLLASEGLSSRRYGLGAELGVTLMTNLRLAGGYNLFGFTDRELNTFGATRKGAYIEFGLKFDESLFGLGARETPCDNACRTGGKEDEE